MPCTTQLVGGNSPKPPERCRYRGIRFKPASGGLLCGKVAIPTREKSTGIGLCTCTLSESTSAHQEHSCEGKMVKVVTGGSVSILAIFLVRGASRYCLPVSAPLNIYHQP